MRHVPTSRSDAGRVNDVLYGCNVYVPLANKRMHTKYRPPRELREVPMLFLRSHSFSACKPLLECS